MRSGTSFILGTVVGAVTVLLVARLRSVITEENIDDLKDRVSKNLQSLEDRMTDLTDGMSDALTQS